SLLQLTDISATAPGTPFHEQYRYSAGQNTGQISSKLDVVTGEEVVYAYDSLQRLVSAATSAASDTAHPDLAWGSSYAYDGFGNLTAKTVTKGSAPSLSVNVNPSTNRITGYIYDANGNITQGQVGMAYDVENRVMNINGGFPYYGYDHRNQRVWQGSYDASMQRIDQTLYFYGLNGEQLSSYTLILNINYQTQNGVPVYSLDHQAAVGQTYFNGRKLALLDRLGSVRGVMKPGQGGMLTMSPMSFYPYGEDKGTPEPNDQYKFATYLRDSGSGLDYAMNRYYDNRVGRFLTPDPSGMDAVDLSDPASWNMYVYVNNDPVNSNDPDGLKCSDVALEGWAGIPAGTGVGAFLSKNSDLSIFAQTVFTESRIGWDDTAAYEKAAISGVIMNRWQFANAYYDLYTGRVGARGSGLGRTVPDWGKADGTIGSIVWATKQFAVWDSPGNLTGDAQKRLNAALNSDETSDQCLSLLQSIGTVAGFWSARNDHTLYTDAKNIIFTSFGSGAGEANKSYYETTIGSFGSANVFY